MSAKYLSDEHVRELNEKHGYFEYADAQGDVSRDFAQGAIAKYESIRSAAPAMLAALNAVCTAAENIGGEHVVGLGALETALKQCYEAIQEAEGK